MTGRGKVILISGVSSGIGRITAEHLSAEGYQVFGTSRHRNCPVPAETVKLVQLDLQDPDSANQCVASILREAGRIDAVINNAGFGFFGALEESCEDDVRTLFETNYFGLVHLTQAVLPIMRAQGVGRIINVSSIAGLLGVPFMGHYTASKFAVEGYSEALAQELADFDIRVTLIEPGFVQSAFWQKCMKQPKNSIRDYDPSRQGIANFLNRRVQTSSIHPDSVAKKISAVLAARRPAMRYTVGPDALVGAVSRRVLPWRVIEWFWRRQLRC